MSDQINNPVLPDDDYATAALYEKLNDAHTLGCWVEFDPEEAERVGAFLDDAMSEEDAVASNGE